MPGVSRIGTGIGLSWDSAVDAFDFTVQTKDQFTKTKVS